jgi:hypothetical protein
MKFNEDTNLFPENPQEHLCKPKKSKNPEKWKISETQIGGPSKSLTDKFQFIQQSIRFPRVHLAISEPRAT